MALADSIAQAPTLEARWLCRGQLGASMIEWFNPFVQRLETREDTYLVLRQIRMLSVKIRGGQQLDIKFGTGDRGVVDLPGHGQGRTQSWKKWSFPIPPNHGIDVEPPDWVRVAKQRRIGWFSVAESVATARGSGSVNREPVCAVELTEVLKGGGEPWWTLAFEAVGAPDTLEGAIVATAALLFRNPPPDGPLLQTADSMPYSEWLHLPD